MHTTKALVIPTADALAFEAAAALDAYEEQLASLRRTGPDPECIAALQRELHRVCSRSPRLPQLQSACVALLLAHHRLLAELADGNSQAGSERASTVRRIHEESLQLLRRECRMLFLAAHLH
jgi:hypothetical protein